MHTALKTWSLRTTTLCEKSSPQIPELFCEICAAERHVCHSIWFLQSELLNHSHSWRIFGFLMSGSYKLWLTKLVSYRRLLPRKGMWVSLDVVSKTKILSNGLQGLMFSVLWRIGQDMYNKKEAAKWLNLLFSHSEMRRKFDVLWNFVRCTVRLMSVPWDWPWADMQVFEWGFEREWMHQCHSWPWWSFGTHRLFVN